MSFSQATTRRRVNHHTNLQKKKGGCHNPKQLILKWDDKDNCNEYSFLSPQVTIQGYKHKVGKLVNFSITSSEVNIQYSNIARQEYTWLAVRKVGNYPYQGPVCFVGKFLFINLNPLQSTSIHFNQFEPTPIRKFQSFPTSTYFNPLQSTSTRFNLFQPITLKIITFSKILRENLLFLEPKKYHLGSFINIM